MGYRGKVREQEEARVLRAAGLTMPAIAERLGISRSSVSLWTRDVPFTPGPDWGRPPDRRPRQPNGWLRRFFDVDESRLRVRLYLHQGLDLDAATLHWSRVAGVPVGQFGAAYRARPDPSIRTAKHVHGCATVSYACSRTHRAVMGIVHAILTVG